MIEPQVWVLIGVFSTIMLGGMTLMTTLINRTTANAVYGLDGKIQGLDGKIQGLDAKIDAKIDGLDAKIEGLRAEMNARFDTVNAKIEHLDRDVTVLMRRAWGEPTAE